MTGQDLRGGVVEDERGGQPQSGGGADQVPQLDGGEGVEAELPEGPVGLDRFGPGVAEHRRDLRTHQLQYEGQLFGVGQPDEPRRRAGGLGGGRTGGAACGGTHQTRQQRREHPGTGLGTQRGQVQLHRHQQRLLGGGGDIEQRHTLGSGDGIDTTTAQTRDVLGIQGTAHTADLGPQTPRERGRSQTLGPTVGSQRIEEGITRRVVGLPGTTEHTGGGREQHERGEVQILGQLVEVPRRVHLRTQHGRQPLGRQRTDDAVIQHARRVHDRRQRVLRRNGGQYGAQRIAVGHITRSPRHLGTQTRQLRRQLRSLTTTAHQQQPPDTVLGHQMTGEQPAKRTTRTGDQHRALGIPLDARVSGNRRTRQPRHEQRPVPHQQLGLTRGQRREERPFGQDHAVHVQVDQGEPPGVLGGGGAHQAPQRGAREIADGTGRTVRRHRAGQDEHQPRGGEALLGEPGPYESESLGGPAVHGLRQCGRVLRARGDEDQVRYVTARCCQVRQVGVRGAVESGYRGAHQGPGDAGRGGARGVLRPVDLEQGFRTAGPRRRADLLGRDRPQGERVHRGDRVTGGVGQFQGHRAVSGGCQADARRRGARRVQPYAVPREGQPGAVGAVAFRARR
ncbi:hypothetical protein EES37_20625 [Streptomyces sp. ADI91-18]|nr:hypothetical protein EES37_20625 [Streptomyces sp. ADI91-18]